MKAQQNGPALWVLASVVFVALGVAIGAIGARSWSVALPWVGLAALVVLGMGMTLLLRRVRAAEANEAKIWEVLDTAPAGVAVLDGSGRILFLNHRAEDVLGSAPGELIGKPLEAIAPLGLRESYEALLARGKKQPWAEFTGRRKDGGAVPLEVNFGPVERSGGVSVACVFRDVTERVRAARALEENRALLQAVLDNSRAVIYIKDDQGRYVLVNRWHETLFKLSRDWIIGRTDYELFAKDKAEELRANDRQVLESRTALEFEEDVPHDDGLHTYISIKFPLFDTEGVAYALCGISTDITARKRFEEQLRLQNLRLQEAAHSERQAHQALEQSYEALRQAEKLSLLGRLVAGVAHEIKNPLACALNDVSLLPRDLTCLCNLIRLYGEGDDALAAHRPEVHDRVRDLAERIDLDYTLPNLERMAGRAGDALKRIHQLCQDLQDFSRPDHMELAEADLNAGVRATVNLITGRAKELDVALEVDLAPLPVVRCAPGRINQVVLNLLANAIDACPPGGTVTLRTRTNPEGVEVHVIDNGHGIEPSIRERIFDPYFTTKPVGQGTGLGLALSQEIICAHGGLIEVDSTPGRGAHFTIRLPYLPPTNGSLPQSPAGLEDSRPTRPLPQPRAGL